VLPTVATTAIGQRRRPRDRRESPRRAARLHPELGVGRDARQRLWPRPSRMTALSTDECACSEQ
jgi:hypothetical protein